ncbi:hypothetical protein Q8F55_004219 [Vanrija albida]|uniref:SWR1-complex protein 5 n=1 Tax=Vanrija albida TaxID=181172 RepID=A0ABR3Q645_9TREE
MSTLATADLGPSDDENDGDFVPQAAAKKPKAKGGKRPRSGSHDSDSDSSSDDGGDDDGDDELKKLRAERAEAEAAERKKRAADAFKAMQEEARSGAPAAAAAPKEVEMVEVKRARRFAGETIYETVRLPKDDPEAIKYLAAQAAESSAEASTPEASSSAGGAAAVAGTASSGAASEPQPQPRPAPSRPGRGPVRKRPRASLEAMSAALDAGKKMTTLEKSQMDWNSHMATNVAVSDEIAAHRRSGGYLEKKAFLERVDERRAGGQSQPSSRRG